MEPLQCSAAAEYIPDPFGPKVTRDAVAAFLDTLGMTCHADDLVLASGTSELFARLLEALTDPGDEVLTPEPGYPMLELIARSLGVVLVPYHLGSLGGFHLDGSDLRRRVTSRSRAIVVTSPHNPTGMCLTSSDLDVLRTVDLPVISDEVFRGFTYSDADFPSAFTLRDSLPVAVLGGLSKGALLPGMKIAWAAISEPRGSRFRDTVGLLCDTYLSASSPSLAALPTWLQGAPSKRAALLRRARRSLGSLLAATERCPALTVPRPDGGWSALIRLPAVLSEDDWVAAFGESEVTVQPGWLFDLTHGPYVVVSLITEDSVFDEGVARICRVVAKVIA